MSYIVIVIVFDASTLILIAKTELLDSFLSSIQMKVCIPPEVERECCAVKKSFDALLIRKELDEDRIRVLSVKDRRQVAKLRIDFGLDGGEAETIVLALTEKAGLVGMDDKNGINACKILGMAFTTAIGILIRMREKEVLERNEALAKLHTLERHGRYKRSIVEDARRKLEAAL